MYKFGTLPKREKQQKRDESGVSSRQLAALMREVGMPKTRGELAAAAGVPERVIYRIFKEPVPITPFTALVTADRLLCALGADYRIHDLQIIPNCNFADAVKMATYEFVDADTEKLMGTKEQIEARARELMALRDQLIGDDLRFWEPKRLEDNAKRLAVRKARKAALAAV
jgi:hypothetical protein